MIGWINLSVEAFICDSFGRDAWLKIIKQAHVETNWVSSCPYSDKITYDLVITGAGILGVSVPQALEAYGSYFVNYVVKQGYLRLLRSLGSNIAEFLANLNNLHLHLTMGFPAMVAPAFRVEQVTPISLLLHYHSIRPALWPIVTGVLKGSSQLLFGHGVEMEVLASREAGDCDHEIFRVTYPCQPALSAWHDHGAGAASLMALPPALFYELFPFHIVLDEECRIVQAGSVVTRLLGSTLLPGSPLSATFKLRHPYIPLEHGRMVLEADSLFLLKALSSGLELKGQMVQTTMPDGRPVLLFLGSPRLATLEELGAQGLFLADIPLHDMSRDFVLLAEQRQAEADLKERFEKLALELRLANERLEQATRWLDEERLRSDALLYRMLPADIAADLREGRRVEAISYPEVTILFSDMVGFTNTSAKSTPEEVYNMLNEMYDKFDALADAFPDVYKLETIGDAYFLVCNLTTECDKHVDIVIDFAIRMQEAARQVKNAQGEPVQIRVGIHTGPVVGGVLGAKTPRFSIYGDTVNVASRMESHGLPGKIHISGAAYARIVDKHKYAVRERGNIAVKGRGNMTTYLIGGTQDDWLLRHSSFDAQIDTAYVSAAARAAAGGAGAGREGSFVITASNRSVGDLASLSSRVGMEAITEGDEDRMSRNPTALVARESVNSFTTVNGQPPPNSGTGGGGGSDRSSSQQVAGGASGGGSGQMSAGQMFGSIAGPPTSAEGGPGELPPMASSPAVGGGGGGGGGGVLSALRSVDSFRDMRSNGSFREPGGPPAIASPSAAGRETSFRAVYARGGRSTGPNSPVPHPVLTHSASRSNLAPPGSGLTAFGGGGGGGGSGNDAHIVDAAPFAADSYPAEPNAHMPPLRRGSSALGHGAGGAGSPVADGSPLAAGSHLGMVMARSVTSKVSPLAAAAAAAAAAVAAQAAAVAAAAGQEAEAAQSPKGGALSPVAEVSSRLSDLGSPSDKAQAAPASPEPTRSVPFLSVGSLLPGRGRSDGPRAPSMAGAAGGGPSHSPSRSATTGSTGLGDDAPPTPSGKSKGLVGKLKSLLKK
ncbi:hypothetical protein HYH03_002469 [Edaphochlamys debaryana]|uniref:guanylate cyclase n=1 Tax=Edaphochlamys debaryana TaxID=47281 RepID=A0A835YE09_9CHLO|nr:hypothetical protein HYH03_002469 [Edaphochlamys debaryana]|eukprot:KAG2499523.1 hypothetical protein HYH03_002469 [Edaphochlamys debaryana]